MTTNNTIIFKDTGRLTIHNVLETENKGFLIINYPDGQRSIKLNLDELNKKEPIKIKCRIKTFYDLEILLSIVASLKKNDFFLESIEFVYLFGMRSDRAFSDGEPNYFRDVVAPIINSVVCFKSILHPHSEASINSLDSVASDFPSSHSYLKSNYFVIAADSNRVNKAASMDNFIKIRSEHGIKVEMSPLTSAVLAMKIQDSPDYSIVIEDDLLDGGGTFIQEALWFQKNFPNTKRYLSVTHAIFSNGINQVANHFEKIFCTNSYQDLNHPKIEQIKVI